MERFDRIDGQILSLLAAKAQFEQAKSYLRSLRGAGRDVFTEMGIAENTIDPRLGPFGWNLVDQLNYGAMVDMTSGSMLIRVAPDQRAVVAARMLMLSPGRYRLHQRLSKPAGAALAHTQWQMSCLASVPSPRSWPLELRSVFAGDRLEVDFEIPPECAAQQLRLVADADYVEGEGQVDISDLGLALLS
jgi:hypothetical protein